MKNHEKPFYLRQPWEILFKEIKLEKISPWSIDLTYLLSTLLEEMDREGIDFRAAGTAISSSVLIYLKKAELLLEMEEPPKVPSEKKNVYLPPPLDLPFRFELTTTTIGELINALEKALMDESSRPTPKHKIPTLPESIPDFLEMEKHLLEIEERSEALYEKIKHIGRDRRILGISDLVTNKSWLEIVRVFMMLLFLAQRGEIDLYQDEDESDIKINVLRLLK